MEGKLATGTSGWARDLSSGWKLKGESGHKASNSDCWVTHNSRGERRGVFGEECVADLVRRSIRCVDLPQIGWTDDVESPEPRYGIKHGAWVRMQTTSRSPYEAELG